MKHLNKFHALLIAFVLSITGTLTAQIKQGEFIINGSNIDSPNKIIETKNGEFLIAGQTDKYGLGGGDAYINKLDSKGGLKWSTAIGGTKYEWAADIIETSDNKYLAVGTTDSYGAGTENVYVIKLDTNGNIIWTKTIGGTMYDEGASICQTSDKGFMITGNTDSYGKGFPDVYIIKLDSNANLQWTKTIGNNGNDRGLFISQLKDKDFIIGATTNSYGAGNYDFYVIRFDSLGNLKWTKTIGGSGMDKASSMIVTADNGYAIAGYTNSYGVGGNDIYVVKLDSNGNLQWTKTIGGKKDDYGDEIIQTNDNGYFIGGATFSYGDTTNGSIYLVRLDSNGNLKWTKTINGTRNGVGCRVLKTSDNGFMIGGNIYGTYNGIDIIKLDSNGNGCSGVNSAGGSVGSGGVVLSGGVMSTGGGGVSTGGISSSGGNETIICQVMGLRDITSLLKSVEISPNPSKGIFSFKIANSYLIPELHVCIYNVLGKSVFNQTFQQAKNDFQIDLSGQPSGVYFYQVTSEQEELVANGKLVKE